VSGNVDEAQHAQQLAQAEITHQEARQRQGTQPADPRLDVLPQACAFQHADRGQGEAKQQQRPIGDEAFAQQ